MKINVKKTLHALIKAILLAAVFLGLMEISLRAVLPVDILKTPLDYLNLDASQSIWDKMAESVKNHALNDNLIEIDKNLLFHVKENLDSKNSTGLTGINKYGYRSPTWKYPSHQNRVLIIGDSSGFCLPINDHKNTWPFMLAENLPQSSVFNISQPGYSSHQALLLTSKLTFKFRPNFAIIYLGKNDILDSPSLTDQQSIQALKIRESLFHKILNSTYLYRSVVYYYNMLIVAEDESIEEQLKQKQVRRVPAYQSLQNFENIINQLKETADKVILILPAFYNESTESNFSQLKVLNLILEQEFKDSVEILNLNDIITVQDNPTDLFLEDGYHLNKFGSRILANELAKRILN